ncbi:MAG TPA: LysR family transcriptional regulator [Polyangiaceae bacterium]|nr:LysR family transcriptional regulator [Polyangiaceae bacterium]
MVDLRGVDLNLLASLDVLLETRNVTHAAERLGISQPAMSAQLARLRALFGDPLLVPADRGRGMVATARALALGPGLRAALKGLEKAVRDRPHFDPRADGRSFRIAATDNALVTLGLPLVQRVAREAGAGVRIAFHAVDAGLIAQQMEAGAIDLLLGSQRMVPPAMKARELVKERFLLAQRKGHPRGATPPDLDEYCRLRHVLVSTSGGSFHGLMDEQLERLGRRCTVALSVQQFTLVPEILRTTDYVSTLPSRLIARFAHTLDAFELPFESEGFALLMAWHPRTHDDPAGRWLRKLLRTACAG